MPTFIDIIAGVAQQQVSGGGTSFTDDFNRANEALEASSNWNALLGTGLDVVSNAVSVTANGAQVFECVGATLAADQYAEATLATVASNAGVMARCDGTTDNLYFFRTSGSQWQMFRTVSGATTQIGTNVEAPTAGDVLRIECSGTTIRGLVNGVQKISVTDSTLSSGASAGFRCFNTSGGIWDDFSMGDL